MHRSLLLHALCATVLLLAGPPAGSTGRGAPPIGTPDTAEGFWVATMPSGVNIKWAILDDGDTWGIYDAQGTILGAFHGLTRSANGALLGSGRAYDIPSGTVGATRYTGSYIPRQAISLTTAFGLTVNGRYAPTYDEPADPAALAGRYAGEGLSSRQPVIGLQMQVAGDGAFVMTSRENCAASGTARPRAGGKAIFDVSMYFAGSGCPLGDGVRAEGIAHLGTASGELFMLALNAARTDGWLYLAQRQPD